MEAALTAITVKMTTRVGRSSTATASAICSQAATRNPTPSTVDSPKCEGASARCTAPAPTSSAATSHCTHPMLDARAGAFGDRDGAGRRGVRWIERDGHCEASRVPPGAVRTWPWIHDHIELTTLVAANFVAFVALADRTGLYDKSSPGCSTDGTVRCPDRPRAQSVESAVPARLIRYTPGARSAA